MNNVAVIIPVYKKSMTHEEQMCFVHNINILKKRIIYLVCPEGLDISEYKNLCPNLQVKSLDRDFFNGLKGYNRLVLSKEFYSLFEFYTFVLICQLDVFLFRDDLDFWIQKNYDYVGAPWYGKPFFIAQYILLKAGFWSMCRALFRRNFWTPIGNGGLSLRKVESFLEALSIEDIHKRYPKLNEDFFWSFFAQNNNGKFHLPPFKEALNFSIELSPRKMVHKNNGKFPMGIHAWERYDKEYWKPIIKKEMLQQM